MKKIGTNEYNNTLLLAILESSPDIVIFALDTQYRYISFNNKHKETIKKIWGRDIDIGLSMLDIIGSHDDNLNARANFDKALGGESFSLIEEYGDEKLSRLIWQNFYSPIYSNEGDIVGLTCFVLNITDRIRAEEKLRESEYLLRESQRAAHIGSFMLYIKTKTWSVSEELNRIFGINVGYPRTREGLYELIHPDWRRKFFDYYIKARDEELRFDFIFKIIRRNDREERWVHGIGEFEWDNDGNAVRLIGTIQDITDYKKVEEKAIYLSYHDELTGLYNRRFFEEEMRRLDTSRNLPISIIIGDMNNLKLMNDIFGHDSGDQFLQKVAKVFRDSCRSDDVIARIGGDEFAILLLKSREEEAHRIIARIKYLFSKEVVDHIRGSISMGSARKISECEDIFSTLKTAENNMYLEKTLDRYNFQSISIGTIIDTLHSNFPNEVRHSETVSELCEMIGKEMGLPEAEIRKLKDAGFLHDIGKVVLDKSILNNADTLTNQEKIEFEQHPVTGFRILNSFSDSMELAESILAHHELWDGSGYPKGLKGKQIPLIARIIAVVEYYDELISRANNSISKMGAISKLKKLAGFKFDPDIVDIFIKISDFSKELN